MIKITLIILLTFNSSNTYSANLSALLKANAASSGSSLQASGTFYDVGGVGTTISTSTSYCKRIAVDNLGNKKLNYINNGLLCDVGTNKYCDQGSCSSSLQKTKLVIFSSGNTTNGNFKAHAKVAPLNARSGADQFCKDSSIIYNCHDIRAIVSLSSSDEVRDMPSNYGISTTLPVYVAYDNDFNNLILTANNWADYIDGSILQKLRSTSVVPWTFTNNGGTYNSSNNCYSGQWETNSKVGATGNMGSTISYLVSSSQQCQVPQEIYCLCYTNQ